jgi:hypothetical protein
LTTLKVFIVAQAVVAEVLSKLFTVLNGLEVAIEVNPDFVSHWDAILHIEKECLHCLTSDTNPARQESNTLSVTDRCLGRGADGTIMRFGVTETLVNIAHF